MIPRSSQADYARLLRSCDLGLALMYTPHPSLVPLEMASAGMLTVTNTFANKDAAAMAALSPNLIAVEPTIEAIAAAIASAASRSDDLAARVEGSRVAWPTDWEAAFDETVMATLDRFLAP